MNDELKYIFSNVNNWLRFAEEKNAALIALNAGLIFAFVSLTQENILEMLSLKSATVFDKLILLYFCYFILFNISGLLVALISFLPQFTSSNRTTGISKNDNLLFYLHIRNYDPQTYLSRLHESNNSDRKEHTDYELDFANQIIVNSDIASSKYLHFRVAVWFTICSVLTPFIGYVLYTLLDSSNLKTKIGILASYTIVFIVLITPRLVNRI